MKQLLVDSLREIYLSSTSFQFYETIAAYSFKRTLKTFFSFIALLSIIITIPILKNTIHDSKAAVEWIKTHNFQFKDGKVSSDITEKFVKKEENWLFVYDPTGKTKDIPKDQPIEVLISDTHLKIKNGPRVQEFLLKDVDDFFLDKESAVVYRWMIIMFTAIFPFIMLTISKLIQVVFLSVFAFLNSKLMQYDFAFSKIINICCYAIIPPSILNIGLLALGIAIPYFDWLYFAMYVLFVIGAMIACVPKEEKESDTFNDK